MTPSSVEEIINNLEYIDSVSYIENTIGILSNEAIGELVLIINEVFNEKISTDSVELNQTMDFGDEDDMYYCFESEFSDLTNFIYSSDSDDSS